MRPRPAVIVVCAALVLPSMALADGSAAPPSIRLARPVPHVVRIGDTLTIRGRVQHTPPRPSIALQTTRTQPWVTVARAWPASGGRFVLRWHVGPRTLTGPWLLRVAVLVAGRALTATHSVTVGVGSAFVRCAAPVPPAINIPAGDGWIVGGLYDEGGPFPGIDECSSSGYTITATAADGTVAATQTVAGGHSYTLVVPAGTYTLNAHFCRGQATVTAGRQTAANTICAFP